MKKKFLKNNGITLVALVVTIIVLLILAAVSINFVLGDNGIITRAKQATEETKLKSAKEDIELAYTETIQELEIGDIVDDENAIDYMENILKKKDPNAKILPKDIGLSIKYMSYKFFFYFMTGEIIVNEVVNYGNIVQVYDDTILFDSGIVAIPAGYDKIVSEVIPLNYLEKDNYLANSKIKSAGVMEKYNYYCTEDNKVYINDEYDAKLSSLNGIKYMDGDDFSTFLAITSDGKLYAKGSNYYGELGLPKSTSYLEQYINISEQSPVIKDKNLEKVYTNGQETYLLDSEGNFYGVGENVFGNLAIGNERDVEGFRWINGPGSVLEGKKIVDFGLAYKTLVVVADDGKVYTAGKSNWITSNSSNEFVCWSDSNNDIKDKKIVKASTVDYSTSFLDENGNVYIKVNSDGYMPFDYSNSSYGELIKDKKIVDVLADNNYTYAIDENGKLYGIPLSSYSGTDIIEYDSDRFPDLKGKKIKKVISDRQLDSFLMIIDSDNQLYVSSRCLDRMGYPESLMRISKSIINVSTLKKGFIGNKPAKLGVFDLDKDGNIISMYSKHFSNSDYNVDFTKQYKFFGGFPYASCIYSIDKNDVLRIYYYSGEVEIIDDWDKVTNTMVVKKDGSLFMFEYSDGYKLQQVEVSQFGINTEDIIAIDSVCITDGNVIVNVRSGEVFYNSEDHDNLKVKEICTSAGTNYQSKAIVKMSDDNYYVVGRYNEFMTLDEALTDVDTSSGIKGIYATESSQAVIMFNDGSFTCFNMLGGE